MAKDLSKKTLGGYYCPNCLKFSGCDCKTCKETNLQAGVKIAIYLGHDFFKCPYCENEFHVDESLEIEMQNYKNKKKEVMN